MSCNSTQLIPVTVIIKERLETSPNNTQLADNIIKLSTLHMFKALKLADNYPIHTSLHHVTKGFMSDRQIVTFHSSSSCEHVWNPSCSVLSA